LEDLPEIGILLNNIANIQFSQENYPEALKRYELSLKIKEEVGNLSGKAICLNNIGDIFRLQENYP